VWNPLSIPENIFLDYPVVTSTSRLTHYARVEYTIGVQQFGYARLEQIRVNRFLLLSRKNRILQKINFPGLKQGIISKFAFSRLER
jgi:hypothetical protein